MKKYGVGTQLRASGALGTRYLVIYNYDRELCGSHYLLSKMDAYGAVYTAVRDVEDTDKFVAIEGEASSALKARVEELEEDNATLRTCVASLAKELAATQASLASRETAHADLQTLLHNEKLRYREFQNKVLERLRIAHLVADTHFRDAEKEFSYGRE